jgi:hypothetical protein
MINTQTYTAEHAVNLIKTSLDIFKAFYQQEETAQRLADLCLGQDIVTHIAYKEKIPIQFLEAQVQNGVVTLRGSTITSDDIQRCETVARQVPGVKDVVNESISFPIPMAWHKIIMPQNRVFQKNSVFLSLFQQKTLHPFIPCIGDIYQRIIPIQRDNPWVDEIRRIYFPFSHLSYPEREQFSPVLVYFLMR